MDIIHIEPDGSLVIEGTPVGTGLIALSPLKALEMMRELAALEWRLLLHPIRDDRPARDDSQEATVS